MKSKYLQGLVVIAALFFFGCSSGRVVSQPSQITLEEAMASVGRGLCSMRQAQGDLRTALIPSEISVTFNIAASGTDTGKLYVDVSSYPVGGGTGKFGTEVSSED